MTGWCEKMTSDEGRIIQLITAMVEVIEGERQAVVKLIDLGQEKRRAVLNDDVELLKNITRAEEEGLAALNRAESERLRLSAELAAACRREGEHLKAQEIWQLASVEDKRLAALFKREIEDFASSYNRLLEINRDNRELLNDAISYVDAIVRLLGEAENVGTYSPQGSFDSRGGPSYINRKV